MKMGGKGMERKGEWEEGVEDGKEGGGSERSMRRSEKGMKRDKYREGQKGLGEGKGR